MSGNYITTATRASPSVAYYAAAGAGGGSSVSTFATASISSLQASTITVTSLVANQVQTAVDRSAVFYTSSLSGAATTGTSTLLFTIGDGAGGGGGTYATNINLITSAVNAAPLTTMFTVGLSGNNAVAVANPLVTNGSATYDVSAVASNAYVNVWLANNGGLSPGFVGTYSRIGF